MSFLKAMQERYTTKKYDASKKIDPKKIEELKEILHLSPSSINSQPWKFTFVSKDEKKAELAKASYFNDIKVNNADTVVVFSRIKDIDVFEKNISEFLPEGAVNYYRSMLKPLGENEIKAWFGRQVYLSLGIFLAACADMGIDATPMEGIEASKYDAILGDEAHETLVAVAIGYRDEEDQNQPAIKPKSRYPEELVLAEA
ncbi:nitroreductase family protein [Jiulongibacter sp. NS-SX5]|uniref:nitroreductase family protein n=1 Tax=Jiulongibacter sp. NS-SX5 TaxID=3463854 RepID=UPI00405860E2